MILNMRIYLEVEKTFKGKKPCTLCRITPVGLKAFEGYVDALRGYNRVSLGSAVRVTSISSWSWLSSPSS